MRLSKTIGWVFVAVTAAFGLAGALGAAASPPHLPPPPGSAQTVTAEHLLAQGIDAERQGNLDAAEDFYRQLLQASGSDENDQSRILLLHRLAVLNAKRKKFEESEQFFQQAVRLDGNNISLLSDFAQLQFDRKQYRDAEIILKYAFLLESENTRILYNLGYSVALQQDRQTEGLRYLKLALGETRALRELAMIYRILGENEQAAFAEQRAAQQEQRFKATGQTPEPPSLEARKELHEQIKRELIRAKSLEFAQELEKAGIRPIEIPDSEEQAKNATATPQAAAETPLIAEVSTPVTLDDPFLARTEQPTTAPPDPWTATSLSMKTLPPTTSAPNAAVNLKPLPETEELRSRPTIPELPDRRTRISNGPTAIPLPPVANQGDGGNRVLRTPPPLADSAAPSQYPRYAEIGSKSQTPLRESNPLLPTSQSSADLPTRLENSAASRKPSSSPSFFDLVQPVNLVALDAHREKEALAPAAPTPEKIDEIAVRSVSVITPLPEILSENEPLPSYNAILQAPKPPSQNVAPSPENIVSSTSTEKAPREKPEEPVTASRAWKEIAIEPYVYVDNVKSLPSKEQERVSELKTPSPLVDPWPKQRPFSNFVTDFQAANQLREKGKNAEPKPSVVPEPPSMAKVEPKPTTTPEPPSMAKVEPKPVAAPEPPSMAKVEPKPQPIRAEYDHFLQQPFTNRKEEPPKNKEELVKQIPAPMPSPPETDLPPKKEVAASPAPVLEPPIVAAPYPSVVESRTVERQPVASTGPPSAVAWKRPDHAEFVRPTPPVSVPEPSAPKQDEPIGIAQTPPSSVRIVNIIDIEPPPDNQPGFARSGKYAK